MVFRNCFIAAGEMEVLQAYWWLCNKEGEIKVMRVFGICNRFPKNHHS